MRKAALHEPIEPGHLDLEWDRGAQDLLRDPGRIDLIDDRARWDIVEYLGRQDRAARAAPAPDPTWNRAVRPDETAALDEPSPAPALLAAIPVAYGLDWTAQGRSDDADGTVELAARPREPPPYAGHRVDPRAQRKNLPRTARTCKCPHCRSERLEEELLPSAQLAIGRWH